MPLNSPTTAIPREQHTDKQIVDQTKAETTEPSGSTPRHFALRFLINLVIIMAATGTDDLLEKSFYAIALIYIQDGVKKICITVHNAELPGGIKPLCLFVSLASCLCLLVRRHEFRNVNTFAIILGVPFIVAAWYTYTYHSKGNNDDPPSDLGNTNPPHTNIPTSGLVFTVACLTTLTASNLLDDYRLSGSNSDLLYFILWSVCSGALWLVGLYFACTTALNNRTNLARIPRNNPPHSHERDPLL